MKRSLLSLFFVIVCMFSFAQNALVPTGGEATGNAGTVSYTIGQIAVQTVANSNASVSEGVQQPFEIQTIGRIRRMPEACHYEDDLLDYCFVYTYLVQNLLLYNHITYLILIC